MAGEWIPVDCNLATKPEVLQVAAVTGEPIEVVVGRMVRLWSWAWHVTADGTIRVPLAMLANVAGGDESYWQAVQEAGWLVVSDGCITIPGWSERFGNAAKRRLLEQRRQSVRRASAKRTHGSVTDCVLEERRGEEKREEEIQQQHTTGRKPSCSEGPKRQEPWTPDPSHEWDRLREAWNATPGVERFEGFQFPRGDLVAARCSDPEWIRMYPDALARLPSCRFFDRPVSLRQFLGETFVADVLCGTFDHAKQGRVAAASSQPRKGGL